MPPRKKAASKPHVHYHKDGTVWARGGLTNGVMTGHWQWYRKDGSIMRSGSFTKGVQSGEWTTYDRHGAVVKVTHTKQKPGVKAAVRKKKPLVR